MLLRLQVYAGQRHSDPGNGFGSEVSSLPKMSQPPLPNSNATRAFVRCWRALLAAEGQLGAVGAYRFDLVDVARQAVAAAFSATDF